MEVSATHRHIGISPQKARLVLEHLPGQSVEDALNLLKFYPSPHAKLVAKKPPLLSVVIVMDLPRFSSEQPSD